MITLQQSAPAVEILRRIKKATQVAVPANGSTPAIPAGPLGGLKFFPYPVVHAEGMDDYPSLMVIDYTDSDAQFAGAKDSGAGVAMGTNSTNIQTTAVLLLKLAVNREAGLVKLCPEDQNGLLDWKTILADTLERNTSGVIDATLAGSCFEPMLIKITDNVATDLAWHVGIEITYKPCPTVRGTRSDAFNLP